MKSLCAAPQRGTPGTRPKKLIGQADEFVGQHAAADEARDCRG